VVKTGKTTVLDAEQARKLLDSIDTSTVVGLRDRALVSVMTFAFARIGAVVAMRVVATTWPVTSQSNSCRSPSGRRHARAEQSRLTHFMVIRC
jgi:site-specific recombinase XerC